MIAHDWIDARSASFDPSTLPESAVSRDLFSDRVLIERKAFMEAQAQALSAEQGRLTEAGWSQVVVQPYAEVQDRLLSMSEAPPEFDEQVTAKLKKLAEKRAANWNRRSWKDLMIPISCGLENIQLKHEELDEEEPHTDQGCPGTLFRGDQSRLELPSSCSIPMGESAGNTEFHAVVAVHRAMATV